MVSDPANQPTVPGADRINFRMPTRAPREKIGGIAGQIRSRPTIYLISIPYPPPDYVI